MTKLSIYCPDCDNRVDPDAKVGNIYTTRSGKKIEAELHFWCVGKKLGNDWLKNSEFKGWLDNTGHLRVDKSMRLVDIPNVFCAGDMTDIKVRTTLYFVTTYCSFHLKLKEYEVLLPEAHFLCHPFTEITRKMASLDHCRWNRTLSPNIIPFCQCIYTV